MNKKLTILLTCYNKEKYISYILRQLVDQNCEAIEVHIFNDGSTDESLNIIQENIKEQSNFYIHNFKENHGIGFIRQYALEQVQSDYFIFADADDMITENYIQTILETINSEEYADIYCFKARTYPHGYMICLHQTLWDKVINTNFIRNNKICFNPNLLYNEDIDFRKQIEQTSFIEKSYPQVIYIYNLYTNNSITHELPLWYKYNGEGLRQEILK